MPDFSAMELEAREINPAIPARLVDQVLKFLSGALFTAALVACGAVLVTVTLTIGVVAAPLLGVWLAIWAFRRREASPAPAAVRAA